MYHPISHLDHGGLFLTPLTTEMGPTEYSASLSQEPCLDVIERTTAGN